MRSMRPYSVLPACFTALLLAPMLGAEVREFVAGDGSRFELSVQDGLPSRAENDDALFEAIGFDTDIAAHPPTLTDHFRLVFKGDEAPLRVQIEDLTLADAVLLADVAVPQDLPGAGFRRNRFEFRASPCPIAHGEPCSAWMFGAQEFRLYRATLIYADGRSSTLWQAEPFVMSAFLARLGERIPDHRGDRDQTAQSEQPNG